MKKLYTLEEIRPKIFLMKFTDAYEMNMHFLRYQEYYESPSPKFRGKIFKILDFMKWYSLKHGNGNFTYMTDWAGFNIPSSVLQIVEQDEIEDWNHYDEEMRTVYEKCYRKYEDFYLIGAMGGNGNAIKHEIAHGFFYTLPEYKKEMSALVKSLDLKFRKKMELGLKNIGYTPKVYVDECQAFLSTGMSYNLPEVLKGENKPFIKLYNKYYRK